MSISTKVKEAIKVSLAFVLVYFIAMQTGWMNPYWAGLAVALIALPTAGQSIHKGLLRLKGTIPGCIAALVILSLASQSRWLFMLLACAWIFFATYMMLIDEERSYYWNVAGFVCLIIALSGQGGSSETMFQHAMFRTLETALGVVVYTLVTVFVWPQTNAGAIRKAGGELIATQAERFRAGRKLMSGGGAMEKLQELHTREVQQLTQLGEALQAEGSESYEVHELRSLWKHYQSLSADLMETLDRLHNGQQEFHRIDMGAAFPHSQPFFEEIDRRFEEIRRILDTGAPQYELTAVSLSIDPSALQLLSNFDRAALAVNKRELENLEALTRSMFDCARELAGESLDTQVTNPVEDADMNNRGLRLPVIDPDHLSGAMFAAFCVAAGFLLWIYANPPGHAGWFQMGGTIAMALAGMQQMRLTILVKPFAVAMALGLGVYVFLMPQLSTFAELGLLLFFCMFVVSYFFTGFGRLAGIIAIIMMISVENQQTYNFAAMANTSIYILMVFFFLFAMSCLLRSPRPEKAVLHQLGRFFTSAELLMSTLAPESGRATSVISRWRIAYCRHEIKTLPGKISAWGKSIDHNLFPNTTPGQVQTLVASLQGLAYRIEQLLDADSSHLTESIMRDLHDDIKVWRVAIGQGFSRWSDEPGAQMQGDHQHNMKAWLDGFETRVEETIDGIRDSMSEEEGEQFYRLLGGYRGVSEAALAYTKVAYAIDWDQWHEERFS